MRDLIKRLRARQKRGVLDWKPDPLCQEAADEIEALRAAGLELSRATNAYIASMQDMINVAEAGRLRVALQVAREIFELSARAARREAGQ